MNFTVLKFWMLDLHLVFAVLGVLLFLGCCHRCCLPAIVRGFAGRWAQLHFTHSNAHIPPLYLPKQQRLAIGAALHADDGTPRKTLTTEDAVLGTSRGVRVLECAALRRVEVAKVANTCDTRGGCPRSQVCAEVMKKNRHRWTENTFTVQRSRLDLLPKPTHVSLLICSTLEFGLELAQPRLEQLRDGQEGQASEGAKGAGEGRAKERVVARAG